MANLKDILIYYRPQTAGITIAALIVGALLATPDIHWYLLIPLGLLIHIGGFSLNNFMDVKADKYQWHSNPISRGKLSEKLAFYLTVFPLVLGLGFGFSICIALKDLNSFAPYFLLLSFTFGFFYNCYSKVTKLSGIFITFYIILWILFGYSLYSNNFTNLVYFVALYAGVQILFQTTVEGSIKDIIGDDVNLAREMKCYLWPKKIISWKMKIYAGFLKVVETGILIIVIYLAKPDFLVIGLVVALHTMKLSSFRNIIIDGKWNRKGFLRICSIQEISTYFILIAAIAGVIGLEMMFLLWMFPATWYVVYNLALYQEPFQPKI